MPAAFRRQVETVFAPLREHVTDWPAFLDACASPLPTCLWRHPQRVDSGASFLLILEESGIRANAVTWADDVYRIERPGGIGTSFPYLTGLCHVQEEVSVLAADALGALRHERVLDLCAAPGGKTARLALAAMANTGTIVANDRSPGRLRALRGNLDRLGVMNTSVTRFDATGYPEEAGLFDRVLVDAPCSCSGTLRKQPTAIDAVTPDALQMLSGVQRAILRRAIALCKSGGTVLYATCSLVPEENELVVDAILNEGAEVHLDDLELAIESSPGLTEWRGNALDGSLERCRRIYPHQNDTGGFFLAKLRKHG